MSDRRSPYFSVVIPVYNRAHLITSTLASVLSQTFQDFEVLVVDDGSTDSIAASVAAIGDSRVRLITQPNAGANAARNNGISQARGRYVALLDSDDRFLPHHLEAVSRVHEREPSAVVYGRVIVDRGDGTTFLKPPRALADGEHMADYLLCDRGFLQTSALTLPTELARRVGYDVSLPFGQDTDFAIRLFAEGARFVMLDEPSAVWSDMASADRVSSRQTAATREAWLQRVRPIITDRAYHGCRGWFVAKALSRQGSVLKALRLYLSAVLRGVYKPRMALVIGVQVFVPPGAYRRAADSFVRFRSALGRGT